MAGKEVQNNICKSTKVLICPFIVLNVAGSFNIENRKVEFSMIIIDIRMVGKVFWIFHFGLSPVFFVT